MTLADFLIALRLKPGPWTLNSYGAIQPDVLASVLGGQSYEWTTCADRAGLRRLDAWAILEASDNRERVMDRDLRGRLLAATVGR